MNIYEAENGKWMFFDEVSLLQVGEANLISVGNNYEFEYMLETETESGEGILNLIRLF